MKVRWNWLKCFWIGMGSITLWPELPEYIETDGDGVASDWKAVGDDIRKAMDK